MKKGVMLITMILLVLCLSVTNRTVLGENTNLIGLLDEDISSTHSYVSEKEIEISNIFIETYEQAGFKNLPDGRIKFLEFDKARHVLYQQYGTDGAIFINDIVSLKPIIIKDSDAIDVLTNYLSEIDNNNKGIILDVVESSDQTYYITDSRSLDSIFKLDNGVLVHHPYRISVGNGTYPEIMWNDYTKAYKMSSNLSNPLGLPLGDVYLSNYTTKDLDEDANYIDDSISLKAYTKQQFENGWIIQARFRTLLDTGRLGGQHKIYYPAAPILNEMYNSITSLTDNSDLSLTGAPISAQYTFDNTTYQNFEYGYAKLTDDNLEFIYDKAVDSKGTEMDRRVALGYTHYQMITNSGGNLAFEYLRVSHNFRETLGSIIRDNRIDFNETKPTLKGNAPTNGIWQGFTNKDKEDIVIFQTEWYLEAIELYGHFVKSNILLEGLEGIGTPITEYKFISDLNTYIQHFQGGVAFVHEADINGDNINIIKDAKYNDWLGDNHTVSDKISNLDYKVTFLGLDNEVILETNVKYNQKVEDIDEVLFEVAGYSFMGFDHDLNNSNIYKDTIVIANYELTEELTEDNTLYLELEVAYKDLLELRANILLLDDELTNLPKENLYAANETLAGVDNELLRIKVLLEDNTLSEATIRLEIDNLKMLKQYLKINSFNGTYDESIQSPEIDEVVEDTIPNEDETNDLETDKFNLGEKIIILAISILVLTSLGFSIYHYFIKKK